MNNLHPIFADICRNVELQPALLERATRKASGRRFTGEPQTGFGDIGDVGSERWREVRDQEHADQQRDERRARIARGE